MTGTPVRCGTVGIAGRPNTGKSSLLNRLVGEKLSIVSAKAQTTRHLVIGILNTSECQYIFVDSPGFQTRHRSVLNRALNRRADENARDADAVLWVVEAPKLNAADRAMLARIPAGQTVIAVVNKTDLVSRDELMVFLERVAREREFFAIVPVSAKTGENAARLLRVLRDALPEAARLYPDDQLTDRDERFFAAELVREKLFRTLAEELPYTSEVVIDSFKEDGRLCRVEATIWVERETHKPIVLGEKGARLKSIGSAARKDMERMFGRKVFLTLWIKVKRGWTDDERAIRALGYG